MATNLKPPLKVSLSFFTKRFEEFNLLPNTRSFPSENGLSRKNRALILQARIDTKEFDEIIINLLDKLPLMVFLKVILLA